MNVAMLQASLPPARHAGGVGHQVHLLATGLVERGHDVTVFVVDDPPCKTAYRCVRLRIPPGRGRRLLEVGRAYARLDLTDFDVVHAHGDDWSLGRLRRIRTFYGSALMEARFATEWLRGGAQLFYYLLEWLSSMNPNVVAISESTRRYLPLVRMCVPCGFDPRVFFPGGERTPDPSILFVAGTLGGRKRGDLLVQAFEQVRRAVPTACLTIVSRDRVVGPGINCKSNVDSEELGHLYRSHWLLASSSSYEGFGVPYVEALASGLPIVTTANDGAFEVLRDGQLGVICSPEDLGRSIVALIRDPERREVLISRGIEAARRYSLDVVTSRYEELYTTLSYCCHNLQAPRSPDDGASE